MNRPISFRLLLLGFLLTGFACSEHRKYPIPAPNAKAESVVIERKTVKIGSETYPADFGTITVPENRSKPNSRLIHLPFLRILSPSQNPAEPIVCLSGGPGESNMYWDWGSMTYLLSDHDVLEVGYRGVDGSTVLDCPDVAKVIGRGGDLLGDESMKTIGRAWDESAKRLTAQGIDLVGYTMLDVIEDNESVRKALGYQRIDLISGSYGTRVAYLYGLQHPASIFRSAMISVNPPGHMVWEPQVIDAQLRRYAILWSADSLRSAKVPDLYGALRHVLNAMPERWLCFTINPAKVRIVTFALLFQRKTAAMVFDAYLAAEHGDASGLALMSLAYDYVVPSMATWGDMAAKAVSADFDSTRDFSVDSDSLKAPLGSPMSKLLWCPLKYGHWPTRTIPEEFRKMRRSDVPSLLLSGSLDFSTPAQFATNELLPYLSNGKQVIVSECGHVDDVVHVNSTSTRLMLTSFFDTGVIDTSKNAYMPMDFRVGWGFPRIAKVALATILVLTALLFLLAFWLIRMVHRRLKRHEETTGMAESPV